MPCYKPLKGWASRSKNERGARSIVFDLKKGISDMPMHVPCGRCIGCRLERSRQWAMRIVHEASMYDDNCFITLTYDDDKIPVDGSLRKSDFQKFMKRLRRKYPDIKIRFFHCGEYGEQLSRPHYHAILFNFDFNDKYEWSVNHEGSKLYRSSILESLWTYGFSLIGDVTFKSAAYVARYIMKKITGENAITHYCEIDYDTGEILSERLPEYITMSLKPGIGHSWFDKYKSDCYPKDSVHINGMAMLPPKYYDKLYNAEFPSVMEKIKKRRCINRDADNNSEERLVVREKVKSVQMEMLKRRGV